MDRGGLSRLFALDGFDDLHSGENSAEEQTADLGNEFNLVGQIPGFKLVHLGLLLSWVRMDELRWIEYPSCFLYQKIGRWDGIGELFGFQAAVEGSPGDAQRF